MPQAHNRLKQQHYFGMTFRQVVLLVMVALFNCAIIAVGAVMLIDDPLPPLVSSQSNSSSAISPQPTTTPKPQKQWPPTWTPTGSAPTKTATREPTRQPATPRPTPTLGFAYETVLYQDTFDSPGSGWPMNSDDSDAAGYTFGWYYISVGSQDRMVWGRPSQWFSDIAVDVSVTFVNGSSDDHAGVICRYVDKSNFVYAVISPDGYFSIIEVQAGEQSALIYNAKSTAIKAESATNLIRFVCDGNQYTLAVNGAWVGDATIDSSPGGEVGLIVGTGSTGSALAQFDDFVVRGPSTSYNQSKSAKRVPTLATSSGATARCRDGTYSYSKNRRGTCSHHGGVAVWLQ